MELRAAKFRQQQQLEDEDEMLWKGIQNENEDGSNEEVTPNDLLEREIKEMKESGINVDPLLEVHGKPPGQKQDGVMRIFYENANHLHNRLFGNEKLNKIKDILTELDTDVYLLNEHGQNLKHPHNRNGFAQIFRGGEDEVRAIGASNSHKGSTRSMEGGTAMATWGKLLDYYDSENSGKDRTGLARWVYQQFVGQDGHSTRIIVAYNPFANKKNDSKTVYQQHRRYFITHEQDLTCPCQWFLADLTTLIKSWRDNGERVVAAIDANEDVFEGELGKKLTDPRGLGFKNAVAEVTNGRYGATYFRGSKPIDAIWCSSDIDVIHACIMPVGYGIGDHRAFIIDVLASSLIGLGPPKIIRACTRRLTNKKKTTVQRYNKSLERNIQGHRLRERIAVLRISQLPRQVVRGRLEAIDRDKQYMVHAEEKCRKIKCGCIPFSPEAALWIRRTQLFRSLLWWHAGKIKNKANLKRACRRHNIKEAFYLSAAEIKMRLDVCKKKCEFFHQHGQQFRRAHMQRRLQEAQEREDEDAEKEILAIIQREKERRFWRRLNYSLGNKRGRSVSLVQVLEENGRVTEYQTQEQVLEAIWNEVHRKRFHMAEEAPICQGHLRGDFGYNAVSPTAQAILEGKYQFPPDFDSATKELCMECARIRQVISKNSTISTISMEHWKSKWRKADESTSSSASGLHFGHYKAAVDSDIISQFHALKVTLAMRRGIALDRWSNGLSVMLEKIFGIRLVSKLRAILLMEADFNAANKEIFGSRMMNQARKHKLIPEEIFTEKNRTADDGHLAKVLVHDIARQLWAPYGLASVDAANCYDRIAHAIASLVFQSFGVPKEAATCMLETIQNMKFFLRTAFGDSKEFASSTVDIKTQGACQGNGAASATWGVISITVLRSHKWKGHGAKFIAPISLIKLNLAAILFVDDTDILHLDMTTMRLYTRPIKLCRKVSQTGGSY